jgi:hypothetical protein
MTTSYDNRPLVGRVVLGGAAIMAVLAILCWTRVLPVDEGARPMVALGLAIASAADAVVGLIFLKSRQS